MTPSFALDNEPYIRMVNAIGISQREPAFALSEALANRAHIVLYELGKTVDLSGTDAIDAATLCVHILDIIERGSCKQMRWIHARRIVATMKAIKFIWDRAIVQLKRESMCKHCLVRAGKIKDSIPCFMNGASPEPTFIIAALVNVFPKSFNRRAVRMMAVDKANRFAPYVAVPFVAGLGDLCLFATTAVAITVGNFLRGIIGVHGKLPFLCQAGSIVEMLPGISIGSHSFNYTMNGAN